MNLTPEPLQYVAPTGHEADSNLTPRPVTILGLPEGGGDVDVAWGDVSGKPSTFPPATHTHDIADVTGLQAIITDLTDRIAVLETAVGEA